MKIARILTCAILFFSMWNARLDAQIETNRIQVYLKLTPRPSEKSVRDREVFFDQQAILRIVLKAGEIEVTNATIQCAFLYDDVKTTGIVKRKVFMDLIPCTISNDTQRSFDSKAMRFTGKISRDGRLMGLKFLASAARVYQDGNLIYEISNPKGFEKDVASLVPPIPQPEVKVAEVLPPKSASTTISTPFPATAPAEASASNEKASTETVIDLYGYKFSAEEAAKIIKSINEFSEDSLVAQIGLSKQAARNLVLKRPFSKIEELTKVSYVKKKAIELLKLYALKK